MLLDGLFGLLKNDEALASMLKGGIHQVVMPEPPCYPLLTYQSIGGSGQPTFDTPGLQKARIQFDARGHYRRDAALVLDALRKLLNGYRGTLSDGTYVQFAELINPEPIDFPFEEYSRDFRCMSEYYFYYVFPD